ncbi:hypothetical protein DL771_006140 [Monosporascus sp. 5C6A]|nr:hypothetical protein DL771_006140 [Monosporascus sp. 5C6A]
MGESNIDIAHTERAPVASRAPRIMLSPPQPELWAPQQWLSTSSALETEMDFGKLKFRVRINTAHNHDAVTSSLFARVT